VVGGFTVNGAVYPNMLCDEVQIFCKIVDLFVADQITQDSWLYGRNASNGVIGMGPTSPYWMKFIDPDTNIASYAVNRT
jgi:hypothetical protein